MNIRPTFISPVSSKMCIFAPAYAREVSLARKALRYLSFNATKMTNTLPQAKTLSVESLTRIFKNTSATYKFYWFMGILDLYVKRGMTRMNIWDLMVEMTANAWYPVCYFRLSFGKNDSLPLPHAPHSPLQGRRAQPQRRRAWCDTGQAEVLN